MKIRAIPVQELHGPLLEAKGVQLFIRREDLNHPVLAGNKWRKLRYNLEAAKEQQHHTLLTFGGAYSNHIYAVAGAGKVMRFKTIGVIRGEETLPLNPTLHFAQSCGMRFHYMDRSTYRLKSTDHVIRSLHERFGDFYLLPEGGTNSLAIRGCEEMVRDIPDACHYICSPVGTGGTLAGLIAGSGGMHHILGFSALKGDFLVKDVEKLLLDYNGNRYTNWSINTGYHWGGYARTDPGLLSFISEFEKQFQIPLDPVYTGKMMFGIFDLIGKGYFPAGSKVLAIHTGGLQGRAGFGL